MKKREFKISTHKSGLLDFNDLDLDIVEEYLIEDLEVPTECIDSLELLDESVHIVLTHDQFYFNDDWYVNLQRVA